MKIAANFSTQPNPLQGARRPRFKFAAPWKTTIARRTKAPVLNRPAQPISKAAPSPVAPSPFGLQPRSCPVADTRTVLRELSEFNLDPDVLRGLVENGLLIGFNIAVKLDGRSHLRVLTDSMDFFRATGGSQQHELRWRDIFQILAPCRPTSRAGTTDTLSGIEISRILLCDRGHVENLILAGCLTAVRKSRPGPGGSWVVTLDSFEHFLRSRQL